MLRKRATSPIRLGCAARCRDGDEWRAFPITGSPSTKDGPAAQRQTFIGLAEQACAKLTTRQSIPAEEIVGWPMLDDLRIFPRGAKEVETAPVIELGRAIITMMSGQLPEPPEGKLWFYGTEKGRDTIG